MESKGRSQGQNQSGCRPQGFWMRDFPEGLPFTTLNPRLFHIMSFFGHRGLVKRDFFHCLQTQLVPREYHTHCYAVEVQTLIVLNPNRRLTEESSQLDKISSIWYFKSPIGDILSNWGLLICFLTLFYQTHIYPIPNWIYYLQLGI